MSPSAAIAPDSARPIKEAETEMTGYIHRQTLSAGVALLTALSIASLLVVLFAAKADASFSIEEFDGIALDEEGFVATQAASHPYSAMTEFRISQAIGGEGTMAPEESLKDVEVDLPAGFAGNPQNFPACRQEVLRDFQDPVKECPLDSQVGLATAFLASGAQETNPLFNIVTPPGQPALLAFRVSGQAVFLHPRVRTGGDYGLTVVAKNISQAIGVLGTRITLWGVPADPSHDPQRGDCIFVGGTCPSPASPAAFVTLPSSCSGPETSAIRIRSWQNPSVVETKSFVSHDQFGNPVGLDGCEDVPFDPTIEVAPTAGTASSADSPGGLSVKVKIPFLNNDSGLEQSNLKKAIVTMPEGTTVNPSSADGLTSCTPAQIALTTDLPEACPESSKLGTVSIDSPLLETPLTGAVYLASQLDNPFGSTVAMYTVAQGHGVAIKLAAKVETDPVTGKVTTTFDDNPQLPFTEFELAFFAGPRAPLALPQTCGPKTAMAQFVPWSAAAPDNPAASDVVTDSATFSVTTGPEGKPCPASLSARPADYGLRAGLASNVAGASSAFALQLTRPDSSQEMSQLSVDLPEGLLAKLAGVPYCPDATLASISGAQNTGKQEIASPSCPAASQIGTAEIGAGAGPSPFYVKSGKAYLAGPYKGAPLSLAVVAPAVAGPFDLGTVVVRNKLVVDPTDAQVHVLSDPLPRILFGIPLRLRDVRVNVNREGFMQAPTNCDPMKVTGSVVGSSGGVGTVSSAFRVANCADLEFAPKLSLRMFGAPPRRGGFPALKAVLTAPKGQANIGKATVLMPKTELLEQGHIRALCTRDQWAADSCPKGSIYGKAKAFTPLLDKPLEGNVYLRSNGGARELPDLVADLRGQIDIELVGYIDAVNARLRARFSNVPDAPVSKFVLEMQGGSKGLLAHNTNVCKTAPRASVQLDGQNGKVHDFNPRVAVGGCGKKGK